MEAGASDAETFGSFVGLVRGSGGCMGYPSPSEALTSEKVQGEGVGRGRVASRPRSGEDLCSCSRSRGV